MPEKFCERAGLISWMDSDVKAFVSHNGRGSSQIDYILSTTPGILKSVTAEENHFLNQSTHTSVCAF